MRKVEKRDGRLVDFDEGRIVDAVMKALYEVGDRETDPQDVALSVTEKIAEKFQLDEVVPVETIQNLTEETMMGFSPQGAKAFILYRDMRTRERRHTSSLYQELDTIMNPTDNDIENENANVDEFSFGGRKFGASGRVHKDIAYSMLDPKVRRAFDEMWLYIHDFDSYAVGMHNCLLIDMEKLLSEGFVTRNTDVRPANSFATACQLVAVIFQAESQFGSAR